MLRKPKLQRLGITIAGSANTAAYLVMPSKRGKGECSVGHLILEILKEPAINEIPNGPAGLEMTDNHHEGRRAPY